MRKWFVNFVPEHAQNNYKYFVNNGCDLAKIKVYVIPRYWVKGSGTSEVRERNTAWAFIVLHDCSLSEVREAHICDGGNGDMPRDRAIEITKDQLEFIAVSHDKRKYFGGGVLPQELWK